MTSILRASVMMSVALLLGRIAGFIREILLSARFGVSQETDAAVVFLTLPDILVALLLAGGVSAALVPALKRKEGQAKTVLFQDALGLGVLGFLGLALVLAFFPQIIFGLLAPQMPDHVVQDLAPTLRVVLIALPLAAASGAVSAYLNATNRFFVPAMGTLIFNLVIIGYLSVFFSESTALWGFGAAVLMGMGLRLISQVAIARDGFCGLFTRSRQIEKTLLIRFVTGVGAALLIVGTPVVFRSFYALDAVGNLAVFNFAQRLYELPAALLFAPILTIYLTQFSAPAMDDPRRLQEKFQTGVRALIVLSLIAVFVGMQFGDGLAPLIFHRGEMQIEDVRRIEAVAKTMYLALPFLAVGQLAAAALNARLRVFSVFRNAAVALMIAIGLVMSNIGGDHSVMIGFILFYALLAIANLASLFSPKNWPQALGGRRTLQAIAIVAGVGCLIVAVLYIFQSPTTGLWAALWTLVSVIGMLFASRATFAPLRKDRSLT